MLDDLSKLFGQTRFLHSFSCLSPFRDWFYQDEQYDVRRLVWFSILPAAISTAYRLLDEKNNTQSLKALFAEFTAHEIPGTAEMRAHVKQLKESNSFRRLMVHRHQLVAHRGASSSAARELTRENETTAWTMEEAVRTLVKIAQVTTDSLRLGSAYQDLPTMFDLLDLESMKSVLRIYGASFENPREQWMRLTNRNDVPGVLELFDESKSQEIY